MGRFAITVLALVLLLIVPAFAEAGGNDITLQRFGSCSTTDSGACPEVEIDERGFRRLGRDLGLVLSPKLRATAETLGPAGFSFQIDQSFSTVNANEDYWERANIDEDPQGTLLTTQLHLRKGLPMSLEIGTMVTFLWQSDLIAIGGEFKWALHEDTLWPVPDFMIRGFGNTVVGHPQLLLSTVGFDAVLGVPIGVGNVVNITPYAGYTFTVIFAGSQIIDSTPGDLLPPVVSNDPGSASQPEFSFEVEGDVQHQGLLGLRVQAGIINTHFEVNVAGDVQTYGLTLGADF
ncbi:MAG: hypothetical protein ACI81R_002812 [Bradymonadia bacterium]|jgi:hypothetical protein